MTAVIVPIITGVLSGGAFAFIQFLIVRRDNKLSYLTKADLKRLDKSIEQLKGGHLVLMRDVIIRDCKKYLADGQIGVMEASTLTDMMTSYEALGGNGFAKELFKLVKKLPLEK